MSSSLYGTIPGVQVMCIWIRTERTDQGTEKQLFLVQNIPFKIISHLKRYNGFVPKISP
jgi:hypothetical protein